jgi:hypothetical protein
MNCAGSRCRRQNGDAEEGKPPPGMMMRRVNLKIESGHGGLFWRKLQHPVADQAGD